MRILSEKQIDSVLEKIAKCKVLVNETDDLNTYVDLSVMLSDIAFIIGGEKGTISISEYLRKVKEKENNDQN